MMRTVKIPLNKNLLQRLDEVAWLVKMPFAKFVQQGVRRALYQRAIAELEQQEIAAYQRQPVQFGEFDRWQAEQAWSEL